MQGSRMISLRAENPVETIKKDRVRSNILREPEQRTLAWLCTIMPAWVSSDVLTAVGFSGSIIIFAGFLGATFNPLFLLLSIAGFAVQWFGDSLDGRIAYYRNTPRKWYGFSLDLVMDWLSTILIGAGFYYFLPAEYKILAFTFVATYGWAMLLAIIKYKITGEYTIDSGLFGPTEFRIVLCLLLVAEIIWPGALIVAGIGVNILLFAVNCMGFHKLLQAGNRLDRENRAKMTVTRGK